MESLREKLDKMIQAIAFDDLAVIENYYEDVKDYLDQDYIQVTGRSFLFAIVDLNKYSVLDFFFKKGFSAQIYDENHSNLLVWAFSTGSYFHEQQALREEFGEGLYPTDFTQDLEDNYKLIKLLLDYGVNPLEKDSIFHKNAIELAYDYRSENLIKSYILKNSNLRQNEY